MNHKIRSIDMKPGQFVIVCEWFDETFKREAGEPQNPYAVKNPPKPVGDPMKVLAIALPFVTVELLHQFGQNTTGQRGVLDTRLCGFIQVDLAYVKSLVPGYGKKAKRLTDKQKRDKETNTKQVYFAKDSVWREVVEKKRD